MRYYIISGEASGDLHAANLVKELKNKDKSAEFRCWGGDLLKNQGVELVKHYKDLAFMGITEVLLNLKTILNNIKFCKSDILNYKPDVVILVDYPGFNLRIAEFAKKSGFKVFYYISPKIWAWKESRIKIIKKYVDKMFIILPFEQKFYDKHNYNVDYVGNPLLDEIKSYNATTASENFFVKNNIDKNKPIIALLPGSRKQELLKILPVMNSIIPYFSDYQFVIAGVSTFDYNFYNSLCFNAQIKVVYGQTYDLFKNSKAAVITSGTATLEAALFDVPQVVCYKTSNLTYFIAKNFIKIKFISLVNLIMDKEVVLELIQNDMNTENIKLELTKLLYNNEYISSVHDNYSQMRNIIGDSGASAKTAELIINYLKNSN